MKNVKCKKIVSIIMAFLYFALIVNETIYAKSGDAFLPLKSNELYALSACLMDADSGRVLYDKNADEVRAMASTTKIMTLIVALEYANEDDIVTVSSYAASMPDVQLNIMAGEQYRLGDLYYAMMLESFNDVAVTIAEYIGECYALNQDDRTANTDIKARSYDDSKKYVHTFAKLMNEKAKELGCENTYFITPNGLDAEDENGKHSTTAKELAVIASYAIKNERFNDIIGTRQYSFCEVNGTRNCSAYNKDAFLNQMNGAFGIKTGFTGNAGYCFVGALKSDGRTFISVVLGSGWPSNRTYKWKDTRKLMEYGINNFFPRTVFSTIEDYKDIRVKDGMEKSASTCIKGDLSLILCEADDVRVVYELEDYIDAPVSAGDVVGKAIIYVNGQRMGSFPITAAAAVERANYMWYLKRLLNVTL